MANEPEFVRELTEEERKFTCFVRHDDAGGQCMRPAYVVVYGLAFCEIHGEEARLGAMSEVAYDAEILLERLRNPHVPRLNPTIDRALEVAITHLYEQAPDVAGEDYERALLAAYSDPSELVRERTHRWLEDEEPGLLTVFDTLVISLGTLCKTMRIAYEADQTWLVEMLEQERESIAAQAAVACAESIKS